MPHSGAPERGLRALPQSSSDIMQKGPDFVREQSGTVTPSDPGVPRDPRWPDASVGSLKLGLKAAELWALSEGLRAMGLLQPPAMLFVWQCVGVPA
jgi:hypothetical protein